MLFVFVTDLFSTNCQCNKDKAVPVACGKCHMTQAVRCGRTHRPTTLCCTVPTGTLVCLLIAISLDMLHTVQVMCEVTVLWLKGLSVSHKVHVGPTECWMGNCSVFSLKKSNEMQQYADIYLVLNYSTCFGRPSRPSSGVHKTVVAASGTDHTMCNKLDSRNT